MSKLSRNLGLALGLAALPACEMTRPNEAFIETPAVTQAPVESANPKVTDLTVIMESTGDRVKAYVEIPVTVRDAVLKVTIIADEEETCTDVPLVMPQADTALGTFSTEGEVRDLRLEAGDRVKAVLVIDGKERSESAKSIVVREDSPEVPEIPQ